MYQVGKLYRWVGQDGDMARYNGTECTVRSSPERWRDRDGTWHLAQETDSAVPPGFNPEAIVMCVAGDLVPVDPPSGERSVMGMFRELEHA